MIPFHDVQLCLPYVTSVDDVDECRRHPLHYAAARGRIKFITELLSIGNDIVWLFFISQMSIAAPTSVNVLDRHRRSPLHVAAAGGFLEVVKLFVNQCSATLTQKDVWDFDPYSLAITTGHLNTVY